MSKESAPKSHVMQKMKGYGLIKDNIQVQLDPIVVILQYSQFEHATRVKIRTQNIRRWCPALGSGLAVDLTHEFRIIMFDIARIRHFIVGHKYSSLA
jgi:hypothetical protein